MGRVSKRVINKDLERDLEDQLSFIISSLTDRREIAVFLDNPIALVQKLKDGYVLGDQSFYPDEVVAQSPSLAERKGYFTLTKKLNGDSDYDRPSGPLGDLEEIDLTDHHAIKSRLDQGWVGIDIKNLGDAKDSSPNNWRLILEKTAK